jgi:hypothetical protein
MLSGTELWLGSRLAATWTVKALYPRVAASLTASSQLGKALLVLNSLSWTRPLIENENLSLKSRWQRADELWEISTSHAGTHLRR